MGAFPFSSSPFFSFTYYYPHAASSPYDSAYDAPPPPVVLRLLLLGAASTGAGSDPLLLAGLEVSIEVSTICFHRSMILRLSVATCSFPALRSLPTTCHAVINTDDDDRLIRVRHSTTAFGV